MSKILVFSPQYQIDVFVDWLGYEFMEDTFAPTTDIDLVLKQDIKIAALPLMFDSFEEYKANPFDYKQFDLILISDIEYNEPKPVAEWVEQLGIKNYLYALGSEFEDYPSDWVYRPWWAFNIVNQNEFKQIELTEPYYEYDVLLGSTRPHRDYVMARMQKSDLLLKSIVNYRDVFNIFEKYIDTRDTKLLLETNKILNGDKLLHPYISPNLNQAWEVREDITHSVSSIVPWQIYEHTKYSVICETKHQNFYMTEKMGKALFAKRLFVVFSSCGYLRQLRKLGFKTFSGIIDESYDDVEDYPTRFKMAFDQLEMLTSKDYQEVMSQAKEILDHNHRHLIDYKEKMKVVMREKVYNKLKEIKQC